MHHRNCGVDEKDETDAAKNIAIDVVHEIHDVVSDLSTFGAERLEDSVQMRLNVSVNPECLECRKADGNQRNDRKQRRINKAHRPQGQLPGKNIA